MLHSNILSPQELAHTQEAATDNAEHPDLAQEFAATIAAEEMQHRSELLNFIDAELDTLLSED
ncbi:MAG: hypothetical protein ACPG4U_06790 [Pseudomonadales bacterium]